MRIVRGCTETLRCQDHVQDANHGRCGHTMGYNTVWSQTLHTGQCNIVIDDEVEIRYRINSRLCNCSMVIYWQISDFHKDIVHIPSQQSILIILFDQGHSSKFQLCTDMIYLPTFIVGTQVLIKNQIYIIGMLNNNLISIQYFLQFILCIFYYVSCSTL